MVFGRYHCVSTSAVSHTQASAQVVRIGHAIKYQQQGVFNARGFKILKQFIQRSDLRQRINPRHHALMAMATAHFCQPQTIRFHQLDAAVTRPVSELAHPRISALDVVEHFED